VGTMLFWFRLRHRSAYGITEALVGLYIAAQKVQQLSQAAGQTKPPGVDLAFALLTASVYLVVRGLDNVHQGMYRDPKDPWVSVALGYSRLLLRRVDLAPPPRPRPPEITEPPPQ
jgi:hypothetical protein